MLMRTFVVVLIVIAVLTGAGGLAYQPAMDAWQKANMPKWRLAEVTEGEVIRVVNATGTIKPVLQISVGAFVSGPIDAEYELTDLAGNKLYDKEGLPLNLAEFNQEVQEGQVLAQIDPRIYVASLAQSKATLASREADKKRIIALLKQATNDARRAEELQATDKRFISQAEVDRVHYGKESLEAQLIAADAAIEQAQAARDLAKANVDYTTIKAPVDGIIINRKIDPGQTLAAQFQTPELFVIAPEMRKKMHVHASVDEADVGLIKIAQQKKLPVTFTVEAYLDTLFEGVVEEIRLSSTTTQNVVTYPVVVAAPNPDLNLLPGMTANLSFEVDRRARVTKIPNAALRFFPQPQHVRKEDKELLEGKVEELRPVSDANEVQETGLSAAERSEARRKRNLRHVWIVEGYKLKAIEVVVGLSDSRF
ncbi:MAG: efflux RND transporter periplasmic adaptor subunit, partial [Planctomycetaceae bacterium]|nr:efflux RND transporter periplasmic adaptor subunit [Planctomycetaceae bacterium]